MSMLMGCRSYRNVISSSSSVSGMIRTVHSSSSRGSRRPSVRGGGCGISTPMCFPRRRRSPSHFRRRSMMYASSMTCSSSAVLRCGRHEYPTRCAGCQAPLSKRRWFDVVLVNAHGLSRARSSALRLPIIAHGHTVPVMAGLAYAGMSFPMPEIRNRCRAERVRPIRVVPRSRAPVGLRTFNRRDDADGDER